MNKYASKIHKLDRLVQLWAAKQRSIISGRKAECGHHYVRRSELITRWDLRNIIPLTIEEHNAVHAGFLDVEPQNPFAKQLMLNRKKQGLISYLWENRLTVDEFLKQNEQKLLEALNENER